MEISNAMVSIPPLDIRDAFREKFFENIASLYENEQLCDVTLIADDKRISAHRVILSASTPYFSAMFTNDHKEKSEREIRLQEVRGNELKSLIDFIYTGIIDINGTNALELMETASRIEFILIEDACAKFLRSRLNASNCLLTWTSTEPFINLKDLSALAMKHAEENFIEVSDSHEFQLLDIDHLLTLLLNDDLNVYSEEEVFNSMSKWVSHDLDSRKCHVKDLLMTIRFSELGMKFLSENVTKFCEQVNRMDLMKDLLEWRLLQKTRVLVSARPSTKIKRLIAVGNGADLSQNQCSEIYCPITNKWKVYEHFRCERIGFCSVVVGNELYILGGYCEDEYSSSVEKYNFSTQKLTTVQSMTTKRFRHAAAVLHNDIFVAGGYNMSSVERFNLEDGKWSNVASMLQPRSFFALVCLNGRILAAGGRDVNYADLSSVECYDPFKKKWKFVAPMNRKRCAHSAVVHRDRLFVVGGIEGGRMNDSVEYYDPTIDKWTLVEGLSVPLYGFGPAAFDDFMIIAGGDVGGGQLTSTVIKINPEALSKENISSMNIKRSCFSLMEVPCYNPDD